MILSGHLLPFECNECGSGLIRIFQPEFNDIVVCVGCRGVGNYNRVIHNRQKVIGGALTVEQLECLLTEIEIDQEPFPRQEQVRGSYISLRAHLESAE